jgi:hypothetical protein
LSRRIGLSKNLQDAVATTRVIAVSSSRIVKKCPVNGTMSSTRNSTPITKRWIAYTPYEMSPSQVGTGPAR